MIKFLVFQFGLEFRFEGFAASGVRSQGSFQQQVVCFSPEGIVSYHPQAQILKFSGCGEVR